MLATGIIDALAAAANNDDYIFHLHVGDPGKDGNENDVRANVGYAPITSTIAAVAGVGGTEVSTTEDIVFGPAEEDLGIVTHITLETKERIPFTVAELANPVNFAKGVTIRIPSGTLILTLVGW